MKAIRFSKDLRRDAFTLLIVSTGIYPTPPRGYGGGERVIFNFSKSIATLGYRVALVDYTTHGDTTITYSRQDKLLIFKLHIPIHPHPRVKLILYFLDSLIFSIFFLINYIRIKKTCTNVNVIVFFNPFANLLYHFFIRWFDQWFSRPLIIHSIASPRLMIFNRLSTYQKLFFFATDILAGHLSDLVRLESVAVYNQISRYLEKWKKKVIVIPNGVNLKEFEVEQFVNCKPDPLLIVYAARISPQKNQIVVVRSISEVVKRYPNVRVLLIGDPEDISYAKAVKNEINKLNLAKNVLMIPGVSYNQLKRIYAKSAIHLVFSKYTGFDVALGENLATQRAIIASSIPAVDSILYDRVNCLLVKPNDPNELAKAIIELIENDQLRNKISNGARKTCEEYLNWAKLAESFMTKIFEILGKNAK